MQNGDIIDVHYDGSCSHGACPLPTEQTLPNLHYLAAPATPERKIVAVDIQPTDLEDRRFEIPINYAGTFNTELRVKPEMTFARIREIVANKVGTEARLVRLWHDGERILDTWTVQSVRSSGCLDVRGEPH